MEQTSPPAKVASNEGFGVTRWTGAVETHPRGGLVGFGDYMDAIERAGRLHAALNAAAYALFQTKRMTPESVREFAAIEHAKACAVLDGCSNKGDFC